MDKPGDTPTLAPDTELSSFLQELEAQTPQQTAKDLQVVVVTLDNWNKAGIGPPRLKIGRSIFYLRPAVRAWVLAGGPGERSGGHSSSAETAPYDTQC